MGQLGIWVKKRDASDRIPRQIRVCVIPKTGSRDPKTLKSYPKHPDLYPVLKNNKKKGLTNLSVCDIITVSIKSYERKKVGFLCTHFAKMIKTFNDFSYESVRL